MNFTEKQKNIIRLLKQEKLKRLNILYGSVRSGKTWITLLVFALWVAKQPKNKEFLMCARTITSLKRNCLNLLQDLVGEPNFQYSISNKSGTLFGHNVYLEGVNDSRAENKIRGMTLQGAYVDEITLIEHDFFTMLLSRLSEKGAKLFGSTNPDSPNHWLKKEYFDRENELNIYIERFGIDDNTFLDPEYIEQIKAEYTGVFYERFINGYFAAAEGLIYPMYKEALKEPPQGAAEKYVLSIDYGTLNAFAALLWARYGDVWYCIDGYYYSGREEGVLKTDEEYAQTLIDRFSQYGNDYYKLKTIVDPSAASFITALRKKRIFGVVQAKNSVIDGIRNTATALQMGYIKINPALDYWIREAEGYVWDDTEGDDRPIKVADHCLTGDTLVMTEDGEKPISELVGTTGKVWSFNTFTNEKELRQYKDCRLTQEQVPVWKLKTKSGKTIKGTKDHLVLTKNGWLELGRCMFEYIQMIDGSFEEVVYIHVVGYENVYNMEVADNHNFAVNGGIIAHNCMDATRYFVETMGIYNKRKPFEWRD